MVQNGKYLNNWKVQKSYDWKSHHLISNQPLFRDWLVAILTIASKLKLWRSRIRIKRAIRLCTKSKEKNSKITIIIRILVQVLSRPPRTDFVHPSGRLPPSMTQVNVPVRRPNPSMRWTVRTKNSVHLLEKTLVRRPNPSMSWTVHFRSFSPNSSHFEPIKQKNAWMVSPIYTLEIQRLSHYCDEKYPNETFDLGMNHNVRTVRCSDCSMFGLFGVRTVRCSDCSMFGLFDVRTVRCSDCSVIGLFGVRTVRCSDCSMFGLFGVRTVRCSDCSMFGLFDVRTVRCSDCSVIGLFGVRTVRCSNCSVFGFILIH